MTNTLLVSNYSSDTGYAWWLMEHFWRRISSRLPKECETFLAYPKVTTVSDTLSDSEIKAIELSFSPRNSSEIKSALKFVKDNSISTIYFTDRPYFSFFYLTLRLCGVKTIIVHDHTPGDRPPINGLKGFLKSIRNQLPLFTADLILNVSPLMRERSIENGRIPTRKCISVQNGLPVEDDNLSISPDQYLRESLEINSTEKIVVCSSRLHEYKNVQFAIRVFASTQTSAQSNAHMVIVGDGPYEMQLRALANEQVCKERIHFLGFRKDVKTILPQCDLAIHCARGEGFSLSIIEFMWSGLPVLVPNVPSVCQAIDNGRTGLIYNNDDLDDARKKLTQLLDDGATRESMGKAAKQTVLGQYTMQTTDVQFDAALGKMGI